MKMWLIFFLMLWNIYNSEAGIIVGYERSQVTLTCSVTGSNYQWLRQVKIGQYSNLAESDKYVGVNDLNLTISNLDQSDDGEYMCQVFNGQEIVNIVTTTLQVQGVGLLLIYMETIVTATIGENADLVCQYESYPALTKLWWTNNDGIEIISDGKKYIGGSLNHANLTIKNVTENDAGIFTCKAENSFGISTAETHVVTGYRPVVRISKPIYVVKRGQNVILDCKLTNGANTTVQWLRNNESVSQNSKYSIGGNSNKPTLTITAINESDRGTYVCHVTSKNGFGSNQDTTTLKVVYTSVPNIYYEKKANDSVEMGCDINDAMVVKWTHNDTVISTKDKKYFGGNISAASLSIVNLTRLDRGIYRCESAYGSVSSLSDMISLVIKDIPYVDILSPARIRTEKGHNAVLPCDYDSYPPPINITWIKDGIWLSMAKADKVKGGSLAISALTINNVMEDDAGRYMCHVENNLGVGKGTILLEIIEPEGQSDSNLGLIAGGGASAVALFILIILVAIICIRRRNQPTKNKQDRDLSNGVGNNEPPVILREGPHQEGLYINLGRPSRASSSDTDENLVSTTNTPDGGNVYCNMPEMFTTIKVQELKSFLFRHENYDGLQNQYKSIPYGILHPTSKAQLDDNMPKNRFKTTFPYDHSRVLLDPIPGKKNSDYINASYIDGFQQEKCYIASQGPTKSTLNDHWRMIWQHYTNKIIMLTNLVEGVKKKCDRYWPEGEHPMVLGNFVLTLLHEKERAAYTTREISIENKKTKEKRYVLQYHFTSWPDHGTPDPLYLVLFHKHVISDNSQTESGPTLVHCSAGIGRTGTYIALDALLKEGRSTGYIDIVKYVKKMRNSRMNMIQTADQYICLHHALLEAFTMEETSIDKDKFASVWHGIEIDQRPTNQQRLMAEFQMLAAKKCEHPPAQYEAGKNDKNISKNRQDSVVAMDSESVLLVSFGEDRSDYINAVYAPSYTRFHGFVATQLPLQDTKVDFWNMISDQKISTALLLLNSKEEANMVYDTAASSFVSGSVTIKIMNQETGEHDIRELKLYVSKKDEKPQEVVLYQSVFENLPTPKVLCRLFDLVSSRTNKSNSPVTVVGSDGARNCGLFCTFFNAVSSMKIDEKADIFQLARLLQLSRPECLENFEEYRLCYEAVHIYLESSNVYANY